MPTLTVCMPNYNHGHYIRRAVSAILAQSRQPDEFFIVDDGSTDDSAEVIGALAKQNPCITFIRHARNIGVAGTVGEVLKIAKSDYFYGAAADDYVFPGFFESAMDWAGRFPGAGILFGRMAVIDPSGKKLTVLEASSWKKALFLTPGDYRKGYLEKESPMHSLCASTVYKTCLLRSLDVRRFEELGHWYDSFVARTLALRHGACYLGQISSAWSVLPGSMSQSSFHKKALMHGIIEKSANLMLSDEFKDVYPEDYVRRWKRGYTKITNFLCHPLAVYCTEAAMKLAPYPVIGFFTRILERQVRLRILNRFWAR